MDARAARKAGIRELEGRYDETQAALQDLTQRLSALYEEVETEISGAEPALATASIALDGLNKRDMNEVKSLTKAPASVEKASRPSSRCSARRT